uniref:uncharacterized protein isoform X1 n=1 Tax=Pristiophorus japonicus TaxID=55135 RepID=UPI00398EF7C7
MTAVLTQEHGDRQRPVGYYSAKLDAVALGWGSCLRAMEATCRAVMTTAGLVLDQKLTVKCPHNVHALLSMNRMSRVTAARWTRWTAVLEAPNLHIFRASPVNPTTMLPMSESREQEGGECEEHDCVEILKETEEAALAAEEPLHNPDLILFTDGSSFVDNGTRKAGWAVTTLYEVVAKGCLPSGTSAQQAELRALSEACRIAEGQTANVYTDSRYAFGVAHKFGLLWRKRGFITAAGTPIRNGKEVRDLLEAIQLPQEVSILKCKAHTKKNTTEAQGNALADQAAKDAASQGVPPEEPTQMCRLKALRTLTRDLQTMQGECSREEKWTWIEAGIKLCEDGVWRQRVTDKPVTPQVFMPFLAQQIHSWGYLASQQMTARFQKSWWGRGFKKHAQLVTDGCVVCQKNNSGPITVMPQLRPPAPVRPFQHLQVDFFISSFMPRIH